MKVSGFLVFLAILISCKTPEKAISSQWVDLFNGKDLNDWTIKIKDHPLNDNYANTFRVEDGLIKVGYDGYENFNQQYGHIYHKKKYSAYLLSVVYRFVGEQSRGGEGWAIRNSGMMLHCQDPKTIALDQDFPISIEAQLLGGNGKDARTTNNLCTPGTNVHIDGNLFTPHCTTSSSKTYHGDQWVNAEVLVLADSIVKHIVETDTVLVYTKPVYDGRDKWVQKLGLQDGKSISEGFISLQSESHPVEFRSVRIFDLEPYMKEPGKLQKVLHQLSTRNK